MALLYGAPFPRMRMEWASNRGWENKQEKRGATQQQTKYNTHLQGDEGRPTTSKRKEKTTSEYRVPLENARFGCVSCCVAFLFIFPKGGGRLSKFLLKAKLATALASAKESHVLHDLAILHFGSNQIQSAAR